MIISIVVTTYFPDNEIGKSRIESCLKAVKSWTNYMTFTGGLRFIFVNSCGPFERKRSPDLWWTLSEHDGEFLYHDGGGVGASLNMGFAEAFKVSPLALYAVDDWALTAPLDLTPWARLLLENESIGMVRLGPPHPWLTGTVLHLPEEQGGWALKLDKHHYAFSHRPALYHERFFKAYGAFQERINALECERLYYENVNVLPGPDIVLALPHPWRHVGETEVGDLEP